MKNHLTVSWNFMLAFFFKSLLMKYFLLNRANNF